LIIVSGVGGIWLERGKLHKLLEDSPSQRVDGGQFVGDERHNDDQGGRKRQHERSLFELFD
jgi:Zn-finger nucleic acid-binding protein